MSGIFSDLTAADWAEFETHAPAACAWLQARADEREYLRLHALATRTAWQQRRLETLSPIVWRHVMDDVGRHCPDGVSPFATTKGPTHG